MDASGTEIYGLSYNLVKLLILWFF